MITEDKIKIFRRYGGDIDSWARSGSKKEKLVMSDDDWYLIDALIQDLFLVEKGVTSLEFNNLLNNKLKENCDGQDTINQLQKLTK